MAAPRSLVDDASSPYYLHPSDSPALVLVSPLLAEDNYHFWSRAMSISLRIRNKLGFVDGSIVPPGNNDDDVLHSAWLRNNYLVISWILNSVSKEIQATIVYSNSAREVWDDLRTRFQQSNGSRIFQLRCELAALSQEHNSVNTYFTKLKTIWDELSSFRPKCICGNCSCGGLQKLESHYQSEYTMAFLKGLNESLHHTRDQILLMDPMLSIYNVVSFVSESTQPPVDNSTSVAFATKSDPFKKRDKPFCKNCNMTDHTINECYKMHGYPPSNKSRSRIKSGSNGTVHQVSATDNNVNLANSIGNYLRSMNATQHH